MRQLGFLRLLLILLVALLFAAPIAAASASASLGPEESERAAEEAIPCRRCAERIVFAAEPAAGRPCPPPPCAPPSRRALRVSPPVGPVLPLRC